MYLVSRTETFAKLFFIVSFTGLFMYVALAFYSFHTAYSTVSQIPIDQYRSRLLDSPRETYTRDLKYILVWEVQNGSIIQEGQAPFINYECPYLNCYITLNRTILNGNYTNFDAIIFDSSMTTWKRRVLPKYRTPRQKYVFYSKMSAERFPICNLVVNNFFNWTWTYKLNSDIFNPFIEVKDFNGNVIAPASDVVWKKHVQRSSEMEDNIDEVNTKKKALVWIMETCKALRVNNEFSIAKLQKAFEEHSLVFDIYGCGNLECPKEGCVSVVERDYFFYLVYENSISVDFVTEMVLKAYHHDAIPIVFGSTDYNKFLPEQSYINNHGHTEETLAGLIAYILRTPSKYREYFNWKKRYTIDKVEEGRGFCQICALLNDNKKFNSYSTYTDFRKWWYHGSLKNICLPKGNIKFSDLLAYANVSNTKS